MYWITRPQPFAHELQLLLTKEQIASQVVELISPVAINYDPAELVKRINHCQAVLWVSPFAIQTSHSWLDLIAPQLDLVTVGSGSASCLASYTSRPIICPGKGSGIAALIEHDLLSKYTKLAIIGSDIVNPSLYEYLSASGISYELIAIYRYEDECAAGLANLEKNLVERTITGIIITSSKVAEALISYGRTQATVFAQIQQLPIICTHPKITSCLQRAGYANLFATQGSTNADIVALIRKIEHDRTC